MSNELKLYHSTASPNSRRVRIFLAEKGIAIPLLGETLAQTHSANFCGA
jgi:glutathione S-transferase